MAKKKQWWEWAELGLLLATFITVIWSFFDGIWQTPLLFICLTLGASTLNRIKGKQQQQRRFFGVLRGVEKKLQGEVEQLARQVRRSADIKSSITKLNTKEEMGDYLSSLEKSLTNVVQYLNQEALDERLNNLEQVLLVLQQEGKIDPQKLPNPAPIPQFSSQPQQTSEPVNDPWDNVSIPKPQPSVPQQAWQCIQVLDAHKDCVSGLSFSGDQRLLVSGSWDQKLKVWQVQEGKELGQIQAHQQGLLDVCFLEGLFEGELNPYAIATSSFEPDVKVWQFEPAFTEELEIKLSQALRRHEGAVYAIAQTPSGELLSAGHDQTIRRWESLTGELLATGQDVDDQIEAIACSPDGSVFVTGGKQGLLKFWRSEDHQPIGSLGSDQPESIEAIAIRPDGQLLVSAGESGNVYIWQLACNGLDALPETVPCFSLAAHDKSIIAVEFSAQGNFLVTGCVDGTIKIWQLGINDPLATLQLHDNADDHARLLSLALSNDGSMLAAGSSDGRVKVWAQA